MATEKRIGVGVGVMIMRDGKVLLGKRHSDPSKAQSLLKGEGTWTMPGGKLDLGESFEEGAARETKEETGIEIIDPQVMCVNNDIVENIQFITVGLLVKDFKGDTQTLEPDEIIEWKWFDLEELPSPIYFPSEKVLANYKEEKFYIKK